MNSFITLLLRNLRVLTETRWLTTRSWTTFDPLLMTLMHKKPAEFVSELSLCKFLSKRSILPTQTSTSTKRASLSEAISNITIRTSTFLLFVFECNLFSCYSISFISTSSPYEQWTSRQRICMLMSTERWTRSWFPTCYACTLTCPTLSIDAYV